MLSHGRLPDDEYDAPVLICSDASRARPAIAATDVKSFILALAGLEP